MYPRSITYQSPAAGPVNVQLRKTPAGARVRVRRLDPPSEFARAL